MSFAAATAGLMADTDLEVGSQQVSCGTAASASSRLSCAGNQTDGRPSLCSTSFAGGFRVAGGAGALRVGQRVACLVRIRKFWWCLC